MVAVVIGRNCCDVGMGMKEPQNILRLEPQCLFQIADYVGIDQVAIPGVISLIVGSPNLENNFAPVQNTPRQDSAALAGIGSFQNPLHLIELIFRDIQHSLRSSLAGCAAESGALSGNFTPL